MEWKQEVVEWEWSSEQWLQKEVLAVSRNFATPALLTCSGCYVALAAVLDVFLLD